MSDRRAVKHKVEQSTSERTVAGQKSEVTPSVKRESSSGSTTANPEIMYSARSWVNPILKQNAISAAVDRNRRSLMTLAAYSDELTSEVVTEASFSCLIAALYSRMLSRLDSRHAGGDLMTGDGLGDGLGDEGGVRGTSIIAVTLAVSMSGVYCVLSETILLLCSDVKKRNTNKDLLDIRQDARNVLQMTLRVTVALGKELKHKNCGTCFWL